MLKTRNADGALGFAAPAPDYPVYSTAMLVSVLARYQPPHWRRLADPTVAWLRTQQYLDPWADHPAFGGFGMGLLVMPKPPWAGHVDISMTRRAIQALSAVVPPEDPALVAAAIFVTRCHSPAGGFVYSPVEPMVNKGVRQGEIIGGYGTATADALIAQHAMGMAPDPVDLAFLRDHHRVDRNPGVGGGPYAAYAPAMKGYYRDASSTVFATLGGPAGWKEALGEAIVAEQRPDGSWRNPLVEQKENDPLVSTGFALAALSRTTR